MTTIVDLIRHGEPVGGRKYRGQTDDPLSEKGWQQMRDAVGDHSPWQRIYTSPLLRCSEFALELAQRHDLPLHTDDRFKEIGFGAWEGKTAAEIKASDPEILHRFWRDPVRQRPQNAEPMQGFVERVSQGWQDLLSRHAGEHLLGIPMQYVFRIQVSNAGITRIELEQFEGEWFPRLLFHGGHL